VGPERVPDWDERYRRGEHAGLEPDALLELALAPVAGAGPRPPGAPRALDLACGAGRHALRLAAAGFAVTAVDASPVAIELLRRRALSRGLALDARVADLEGGAFLIEPEAFDLVCVFFYLQRDLFAPARAGLRRGGLFVAAIHTIDDDPSLRPMNPAFLLRPGELREEFAGWHLLHYEEAKEVDNATKTARRRTARLIARRPV
jgi:tellurite methyltransferase